LETPEKFPLLQVNDFNKPAFDLIQSLYDQATNVMRLDNKSSDSNRWQIDRKWRVRIINANEQIAFVIPGGDLYISRGLLKELKSESELYYVLATEATIMNERYLLREMISAYSTRTLSAIALNQNISDSRIKNMASELPRISFGIELMELLNYQVLELICDSSIYCPNKAAQLINQLSKTDQWLSTRPINISNHSSIKCGNIDTKGLYQTEVLDRIN